MYIPKIIHQTWKDENIPDKWKKSNQEWQRLHPDWKYVLWTDDANRSLIKTKFPWFLETYDGFKHNIQRVDAVRYFILYEYGGVYSDLDLYPVQSINKIFDFKTDQCYFTYSGYFLTNNFMVSKKGAIFWLDVFKEMECYKLPTWANCLKHFEVELTTGPMMIDRVIKKHLHDSIGLLPKGFRAYSIDECVDESNIKEGTYLVPLQGKSWCGWDSHLLNFINKYKEQLSVLGIVFLIFIIVLLVYFFYKYVKYRIWLCKTC